VHNARPRNQLSKTVFADLAIAKKKTVNADKAIVVQGLHHTNIFSPCGVVGGWRD
jgi:hypothetical protein